jgi:hypothetical protein
MNNLIDTTEEIIEFNFGFTMYKTKSLTEGKDMVIKDIFDEKFCKLTKSKKEKIEKILNNIPITEIEFHEINSMLTLKKLSTALKLFFMITPEPQEKTFIEIPQEERKEFFEKHNFFPDMNYDSKRCCIHCNEIITVSEYKIELLNDMKYICCPNAPSCTGTLLDFMTEDFKR